MRSALTLVRSHGEQKFAVAVGPEISIDEQMRHFKRASSGGKCHETIAEMQLWISDAGISKRVRFGVVPEPIDPKLPPPPPVPPAPPTPRAPRAPRGLRRQPPTS
ncbi:MAG TPA: hypothetical protein VF614_13895 [Chthoniobacteraceae bacterium]